MKNYTTLYLDLDNTIFDFNKSENRAIRSVLKLHKLPCDEETARLYSSINLKWWKKFERGEISKNEIFTGRFSELLSAISASGNPKAMSLDYFKALSCGHDLIDGAIFLLKSLKACGYILCATTNGVSMTQHKRINDSGIGEFFDYVFVSEDAGHQKPEREYFDYVINNSPEKDRSKILIIGDSQTSDILGGINSGIDTCWYNPRGIKPAYKSLFEAKSLFEISDMLCKK